MDWSDCLICRMHRGDGEQPPGGYIYEDAHWRVCHARPERAVPGHLHVVSRRHFLDFGEMTPEEAGSLGPLLTRLFAALRRATGAERIYFFVMLEHVPHFHAHLVPRRPDAPERGLAFLSRDWSCTPEEAAEAAARVAEFLRAERGV